MTSSSDRTSAPEPELPPGLDLLWGRRERGKRGPRPGLSPEAIVDAAFAVADAEGLEAVSMARVAKELGFTTMSLYRHVASKDELLRLMWDASARGIEDLELEGSTWRERLRHWALVQHEALGRHPWITQMPMAAPPVGPNSMRFVEKGLAAMDGTGLSDPDKMRMIGVIASYSLSEARMTQDAARAAAAGTGTAMSMEAVLREVLDEQTYPRMYRLAWARTPQEQPDEQAEFLFGLDRILDGIESYLNRQAGR